MASTRVERRMSLRMRDRPEKKQEVEQDCSLAALFGAFIALIIKYSVYIAAEVEENENPMLNDVEDLKQVPLASVVAKPNEIIIPAGHADNPGHLLICIIMFGVLLGFIIYCGCKRPSQINHYTAGIVAYGHSQVTDLSKGKTSVVKGAEDESSV